MTRCLRLAAIAALAVALVVVAERVDLHGAAAALAGASVLPFALAIALNLFGRTAVRATRTHALLAGRVAYREVVRLTLAGYAASALLPGPAEELTCGAALVRRNGLTAREVVSYQAIDKLLGIASVALVLLPLLPAPIALPAGVLAVVALAVAAPRLLAPLGWLVISNLICIAMIALCLGAVGAPASACWQIFGATSLATALPLVPGNVGTLESAFVLVAVHHGVAAPVATAAAVLYHLAQVAPTAIAGLPQLCRLAWEAGR